MSLNKIIQKNSDLKLFYELNPGFTSTPENEKIVFDLILYFTNDSDFEKDGMSLSKGILICGGIGTGKTTIFKAFHKFCKKIQSKYFIMAETRHIIRDFQIEGATVIDEYGRKSFLKNNGVSKNYDDPFPNKKKPFTYFFDDLGLEETNSALYGNRSNVIAEIIFDRYNCFIDDGMITHAATNLDTLHLTEIYGNRFSDRCKEMFNYFVLYGKSMRDSAAIKKTIPEIKTEQKVQEQIITNPEKIKEYADQIINKINFINKPEHKPDPVNHSKFFFDPVMNEADKKLLFEKLSSFTDDELADIHNSYLQTDRSDKSEKEIISEIITEIKLEIENRKVMKSKLYNT